MPNNTITILHWKRLGSITDQKVWQYLFLHPENLDKLVVVGKVNDRRRKGRLPLRWSDQTKARSPFRWSGQIREETELTLPTAEDRVEWRDRVHRLGKSISKKERPLISNEKHDEEIKLFVGM